MSFELKGNLYSPRPRVRVCSMTLQGWSIPGTLSLFSNCFQLVQQFLSATKTYKIALAVTPIQSPPFPSVPLYYPYCLSKACATCHSFGLPSAAFLSDALNPGFPRRKTQIDLLLFLCSLGGIFGAQFIHRNAKSQAEAQKSRNQASSFDLMSPSPHFE